MQLEGEGGFIVRLSFKKRIMNIWWDLNLWPGDNWLCTLPLDHQGQCKYFWHTYLWWISIQLRIIPGKELKLNRKSAKNIMTTFAYRYVSYLLFASRAYEGCFPKGWAGAGGVNFCLFALHPLPCIVGPCCPYSCIFYRLTFRVWNVKSLHTSCNGELNTEPAL